MRTCAFHGRASRAWRRGQQLGAAALAMVLVLAGGSLGCRSGKSSERTVAPQGWLPSRAQVATLQGSGCRGRNPGASWRKLRSGDWLEPGAAIEVSPASRMALRLYEVGIMVDVKPGTVLRLDKLNYRRDGQRTVTATILTLRQGQVGVDRSNLAAGSEFEIRTPQGVTRIPPGTVR